MRAQKDNLLMFFIKHDTGVWKRFKRKLTSLFIDLFFFQMAYYRQKPLRIIDELHKQKEEISLYYFLGLTPSQASKGSKAYKLKKNSFFMEKRALLTSYLCISVAMAILGIVDAILSYLQLSPAFYSIIVSLLALLFFFYNILIIFIFLHHHFSKITFVLPIYYILAFLISGIIGSILILKGQLTSATVLILFITSLVQGIFELTFSGYLLKRLLFQKPVQKRSSIHGK